MGEIQNARWKIYVITSGIIMTLRYKTFKRLVSATEIKIKSREHNSSVFKIWKIQFGILPYIL